MASTGKKGKKNKGKTVPLNDFLSSNTPSWSDQVDEADKLGEFLRKPNLPAAPRAARAIEIDESRIPKFPPYVAYLTNLSYELEEEDVLNAFTDLNIANVRLPKDERSGRMKGFGYLEFDDKQSLIAALQKHEATIRGRRIKIDIAENEGERRRSGFRDNRDRESNYDSERSSGAWRSGPRSEFLNDDRRGPSSGRRDYGGFRDRDYDKNRGDKDSSWRDNERRYGGDWDNKGSYSSRRNYDDSESSYSEPKTRRKLCLKPRTVPIEDITPKEDPIKEEKTEEKKSSASIFGQAKPVDTAAREREIEERLEKEREGAKNEKNLDMSKARENEDYSSSENKVFKLAPESKENVWMRKSQKNSAENNLQSSDNGKGNESEETSLATDIDTDLPKNSEDTLYDNRRSNDLEDEHEPDIRYKSQNKTDDRYSDRNRDGDRSYRKDDRWRDDKDRRDRREYDRRDREYDTDKRGGISGEKIRDQDRDGDSRRLNDRDGDYKKSGNGRDVDWRKNNDKDGDNKRFQDRESLRYKDQDDHGNKGLRGDKRIGPSGGDKGSRVTRNNQERERGPLSKDKSRDQRKSDDGFKMPKFKEAATPDYIGTNKYSFLEEDGVSE